MDKIRTFYKLCRVKLPEFQDNPIISQVSEKAIEKIFSEKEKTYYTKQSIIDANTVTIRENVIGGEQEDD